MERQRNHEYDYAQKNSELDNICHQHRQESTGYRICQSDRAKNQKGPPNAEMTLRCVSGKAGRGEDASLRDIDEGTHHHRNRIEGNSRMDSPTNDTGNRIETDSPLPESDCKELSGGFYPEFSPFARYPFTDEERGDCEHVCNHSRHKTGFIGNSSPYHKSRGGKYSHVCRHTGKPPG